MGTFDVLKVMVLRCRGDECGRGDAALNELDGELFGKSSFLSRFEKVVLTSVVC